MPNEPHQYLQAINGDYCRDCRRKKNDPVHSVKSIPNGPQKDLVAEARAKLAKPNYGMGKRNRELMTQLCDEVERLRRQIKTMQREAREDAMDAAAEARWQERQGEDYGSY